MGNFINYDKSYGLQNTFQGSQSPAIIAQRDPRTTDAANPGQYWLNQTTHTGFICNGAIAGAFQWSQLAYAPGDLFPTLTVNPGPFTFLGNGTFGVQTSNNTVGAVSLIATDPAGGVTIGDSGGGTTISSAGGRLTLGSTQASATAIVLSTPTAGGGITVRTNTGGFNVNTVTNFPTNINSGTSTGTITIGNVASAATNITGAEVSIVSNDVLQLSAITSITVTGLTSINQNFNANTLINSGTSNGSITVGNLANSGVVQLFSSVSIGLRSAGIIPIRADSATANAINLLAPNGGISMSSGGNVSSEFGADAPVGFVSNLATNIGAITIAAAIGMPAGGTGTLTINNGSITVNSIFLTSLQMVNNVDEVQIIEVFPQAGNVQISMKNVGAGAVTGAIKVIYWIISY